MSMAQNISGDGSGSSGGSGGSGGSGSSGGGLLKINSVSIPTYAGLKTGF